jgi:hypothetical protein
MDQLKEEKIGEEVEPPAEILSHLVLELQKL